MWPLGQPAADPIDARYVGDLKHEDGGEVKVGIEGVNKAEGEATGPEPEARSDGDWAGQRGLL